MDEIGVEWFSNIGNTSIKVVQKKLIARDADINEMLKIGIAVGFGKSISSLTSSIENRTRIMCRRALEELHPGPDEEAIAPQNLPLLTFLAFVGITIDCIHDGQIEEGMDMFFISGMMWGEIESKFLWQNDTVRGQKVASGSKNAAHSTNSRHFDIRNKRMSRMAELLETMTVTCASSQCECDGLGKAGAVRKTWYRYRNNCDS